MRKVLRMSPTQFRYSLLPPNLGSFTTLKKKQLPETHIDPHESFGFCGRLLSPHGPGTHRQICILAQPCWFCYWRTQPSWEEETASQHIMTLKAR